jgi:hypothetical protein
LSGGDLHNEPFDIRFFRQPDLRFK